MCQELASRFVTELAQTQSKISEEDYSDTIKSLAIAVDLVVATVATQAEADATEDTLQGLMVVEEGDVVTVESVPLYAACLRGRAALANRWSVLHGAVLQATRRFLVQPSPILVQLHRRGAEGAVATLHKECCDGLVALLQAREGAPPPDVVAFLSSLSASSSVLSDGNEPLVVENVSKALVAVACDLQGTDGASVKHCVTLLYQKLFFPPSRLDVIILHQLGTLAAGACEAAFPPVADVLEQVTRRAFASRLETGAAADEGSEDPAKYRYILEGDTVASTLHDLGRALASKEAQRFYMLQRLFEVFRALAIAGGLARDVTGHEAWIGVLLPAMGQLAKGTVIENGRANVVVFRDFWFRAVVAGLVGQGSGALPASWRAAVSDLGEATPTLINKDAEGYSASELAASSNALEKLLAPRDIATLQADLASIPRDTSMHSEVQKLSFSQVVYLLAMHHVQTFSLLAKRATFSSTFEYLEDKGVQSSALAQPTWILVNEMFGQYLRRAHRVQDDRGRRRLLDNLAIYLLVKFNHRAQSVKEAADRLLSSLVDRFPFVLWSAPVVSATLDILSALADTTVGMEPISVSFQQPLPFAPHHITVPATRGPREDMVEAFAMHSREILKQAMSHASRETSAALHDYLSKPRQASPGAARARLFAQQTLAMHNQPGGADPTVILESGYVAAQNFYRGQLGGILSSGVSSLADWTSTVLGRLAASGATLQPEGYARATPEEAAAALEALSTSMFQACAVLAESRDRVTDLVQALVWTPVRILRGGCMRIAVECWRWVVSMPGCEVELMAAIEGAWCWTVERRLGIFSGRHGHSQSREQVANDSGKEGPESEAHELWLGFLQERLDVVKHRSMVHATIFADVVHRSLMDRHLNLHPCTVAARCALFKLAMNVLRSDHHIAAHHLYSLRSRFYDAVLDTFAVPAKWPLTAEIGGALAGLVQVWQLVYQDKKVCKQLDATINMQLGQPVALDCDHGMQVAQFARRRNLALVLLRHEIDRLAVWYRPAMDAARSVVGLEAVQKSTKPSPAPSDATWREYIKLAWKVNPALVVFIAFRFESSSFVYKEVTKYVTKSPAAVMHLPEAIHFLVQKGNTAGQSCKQILEWAPVAPITALSLLKRYPGHPIISQYAIRVLLSFPPDVVLFAIPQIVQALRYDDRGYVYNYIKDAAGESQLLAHQLIWNMRTNLFLDEESEVRDPVLYDVLVRIMGDIERSLSGDALQFYQREFAFFKEVTGISGSIRDRPLGPLRKEACLEELAKIELKPGCYLPSNPEAVVVSIDKLSGTPMQSAAKAPFLARFQVQDVAELSELEHIGDDHEIVVDPVKARWMACIFKVGDDVRQDMLALQVIRLFKDIFHELDLEVNLFPYRVVATSPGCGVIECVPNAKSRGQLGEQTNATLYEYFVATYGDEDTVAFQEARLNFIRSMAPYSVIGLLLQIKDRHNGNIMIDKDGNIIHIDFGFMFESSPGGNIGFEPDIKLTSEMVAIMGGDQNAAPYRFFIDLCVRCYLAVRPYQEQVVALVELMLDTGLPCFRSDKVLTALR